ncbi:MAG: hypothetical protein K6T65_10780 [Peptococcaceae bacterium]|nr:hypothetical protein [Peptococcaceae bacterium]
MSNATIEKFEKVMDLKNKGYSLKEISEKLSASEGYIKNIWRLRRLNPELLELFRNGKLSTTLVRRLSSLPPEKQAEEYAKIAKPGNSKKKPSPAGVASEDELVKKLILDGIIGVNMGRIILNMPEGKRQKVLKFLTDPESSEAPEGLNEEIEEKRRELEILNRQINAKKKSITLMNYSREVIKHLIKAEDTIRELARGGVDAAYMPELLEWLGVLRRVQDIFRNAMATVQAQGFAVQEASQERSYIDV